MPFSARASPRQGGPQTKRENIQLERRRARGDPAGAAGKLNNNIL